MNVAIGRLWNVYDSTAIWTIDDGVYVAPEEPDEPDPGDPEEPDEEIVYTNDFAAYPDLPIYSIGSREDGMNYRIVPLETETDVFPLTYTQNGITYGICFEYARHLVGSVPETSSIAGCYDGVLCEIFNISFNGGMTTVLFYYYIYNENGGVEYSIALVGEDFADDYIVFDMMIFGGYVDFNDFMSSEYSLRSAGNTETLVATYAYDANGNRTSLTYANGTTTTYVYNEANLVTSVLNKKGTTTLSSHSYMYYLDGNIASETANSVETAYEYDGLGRLTKEDRNGTITLYTYDACGNRATMTQNNVTTTYTYDANNRLWKETVSGIATTYAYDANGNMISALKGGNAAGAYAYNLFGNQISFTTNDSLYTYYTYRPDGLRHSIGDTVHIWDGSNIVADLDGSDVVVYIRGINLIYADDGDKTYYHFNAHGDVVVKVHKLTMSFLTVV